MPKRGKMKKAHIYFLTAKKEDSTWLSIIEIKVLATNRKSALKKARELLSKDYSIKITQIISQEIYKRGDC